MLITNVKRFLIFAITTMSVAVVFNPTTTFANPTGGNVAYGSAAIFNSGNTTTITQSTQQAIINWQSFNIANGQTTNFNQPAHGVALNRDMSGSASQIYGALNATGQIILVNQAGIHFGPSAMVNVGGIIASTSDISDANFIAGKYVFNMPGSGTVNNEGTIIAANNGLAALIGTNVENHGVIKAELGNIVLASGNTFTLDFYGDQLINFAVNDGVTSSGNGVKNTGKLLASGGTINVSAKSAQGVLDNVVYMSGVAQANSVSEKNGVIILDAGTGSAVVSGVLDVSSKTSSGGKIKVAGKNISITSSAVLNADAGTQGNGGDIKIISSDTTSFAGNATAIGGVSSGNGGSVETSGKNLQIANTASVNLLAPVGKTGVWLLDPATLEVVTGGTGTVISGQNDNASTIDPLTVNAALNSANLILNADTNITITNAINWSSNNTLTLSTNTSGSTININAGITGVNGGLVIHTAAASDVVLTSDAGSINVNSFILQNGAWTQVAGQNGLTVLPSFAAPGDFEIQNGNFLRSAGIDNSAGYPVYEITDVYGLQGIANNLSSNFELMNDIDASSTANWNGGAGFIMFGTDNGGVGNVDFTGIFKGRNNTISDLTINNSSAYGGGLFAAFNGFVDSLTLKHIRITGTNDLGGLIGFMDGGTVENVNVIADTSIPGGQSTINSGSSTAANLGGLIGVMAGGSVSGSSSSAQVLANPNSSSVGGFVGDMRNSSSVILLSSASGDVAGMGNVGGFVGRLEDGSIFASFSTGTVSATASGPGAGFGNLGGFVGYQQAGLISNSYSASSVSTAGNTRNSNIGGFVGLNNAGTITGNSFSTGSVTADDTSDSIGGFAGYNIGTIQNAFSSSNVTVGNNVTYVGGFVGTNDGTISQSFSIGTVTAGEVAANVGGFVGNVTGSITDSYTLSPLIFNLGSQYAATVGGFVGAGQGNISNSYNANAMVFNGSGFGAYNIGGFVGFYITGTYSNVFFDQGYTGQNSYGSFNSSAPTGITGGTFNGTNIGSLASSTTYTGWDFTNTWGILEGSSYPYLLSFYSNGAPRAISGTVYNSSHGDSVQLSVNGTPLITGDAGTFSPGLSGVITQGTSQVGANGFYYFLESNNVVPDNASVDVATSVSLQSSSSTAPASGASMVSLNIGGPTQYYITGIAPIGDSISLAINGNFLQTVTADSNGNYSFQVNFSVNDLILLYLSGGSDAANYLVKASAAADISNLNLSLDTIDVGNATGQTYSFGNFFTSIQNLSAGDSILFSNNSGQLNLGNNSHQEVNFNVHDNLLLENNITDSNNGLFPSGYYTVHYIIGDNTTQQLLIDGTNALSSSHIFIEGNTPNSSIVINSKIDDVNAGNTDSFNPDVQGGITINGEIGSTTPFESLSLGSFGNTLPVYINNSMTIQLLPLNISNTFQIYRPVILGNGDNIVITGNSTFYNTIDGAADLTLNGEAVNFVGNIGAQTPLTSLTVNSTNAYVIATGLTPNPTTFNDFVIATTGDQQYASLIVTGYNGATQNAPLDLNAANVTISGSLNVDYSIFGASSGDLTDHVNFNLTGNGSSSVGNYSNVDLLTINAPNSSLTLGANTSILGTETLLNSGMLILTDANSLGVQDSNNDPLLNVAAGANVLINGVTLNIDGNGSSTPTVILNNGSTLAGASGAATSANGQIELNGSVTIQSNSSLFRVQSAVDSGVVPADLTVGGAGTLEFYGIGNNAALNSIVSNAPIVFFGQSTQGNVNTLGNQTYNASVTVDTGTATLHTDSGTIAINAGATGSSPSSYDLVLTGSSNNQFIISSGLSLNSLTVTGGTGVNSLTVNSPENQTWNISGVDSGNITGIVEISGNFSFSNIGSLASSGSLDNTFFINGGNLTGSITGGSGNNTLQVNNITNTWNISGVNAGSVGGVAGGFSGIQNLTAGAASGNVNISNNVIFANGGQVSGLINMAYTPSSDNNTLDYSAYLSPVKVYLTSSSTEGYTTNNNTTITNFINFGNLIGQGQSTLYTPLSNTSTITITGYGQGYVDDPTNFSGFTNFLAQSGQPQTVIFNLANTPTYNPTTGQVTLSNGQTMNFSNYQASGTYDLPSNSNGGNSNSNPPASNDFAGAQNSGAFQSAAAANDAIVSSVTFSSQYGITSSNNNSGSGSDDGSDYVTANLLIASPISIFVNNNLRTIVQDQQSLDLQILKQPLYPNC